MSKYSHSVLVQVVVKYCLCIFNVSYTSSKQKTGCWCLFEAKAHLIKVTIIHSYSNDGSEEIRMSHFVECVNRADVIFSVNICLFAEAFLCFTAVLVV